MESPRNTSRICNPAECIISRSTNSSHCAFTASTKSRRSYVPKPNSGRELREVCLRLPFRMPSTELLHTISPSNESTIAVEVIETRLMRKHKHVLVFENYTGELHYSPDHLERSRLTIDIDS